MALKVNFEPASGKPGTSVEATIESDEPEKIDYVMMSVTGQPFSRRAKKEEGEDVFSFSTTVPYGAPRGSYKIKFKPVGEGVSEEPVTKTFTVT